MQDLVNVLEGIVPTCRTEGQYLHPSRNTLLPPLRRSTALVVAQHGTRSCMPCMLGRSQSIPIADGQMTLGESSVVSSFRRF